MTTELPDREHLSVGEVARYLRVSDMTIYRMVHAGTLPAVRIGRRSLRIARADMFEYLRQAQAANSVPADSMTVDRR